METIFTIVQDMIDASVTSSTIKQTEIDFGSTPINSKIFTITEASATATSKILVSVAYDAPTGKELDELEMDTLYVTAGNASAGQFDLIVSAIDGSYLHDKFKINYLIT